MPARGYEHEEEQAPERAADAAAPAPALPVARMLALQRSAGNAAVARMIATDRRTLARDDPVDAGVPPVAGVPMPAHIDVVEPRAGDVDDMDRAIREHFSNEDWQSAARVLNGFSQEDIEIRMRRYDVGQRTNLAAAATVNGAAADRIRKVAEFENAMFFAQWEAAALALANFPDQTRVEPRLRLTGPYPLALILMHAERASQSTATVARTLATARAAEMATWFANAVSHNDWDGAAALLNALPDADVGAQLAVPPRTAPQLFDINRRATYWGLTRVVGILGQDPRGGMIATEGLDRTLREQITAENWSGVTSTLERYNTDDERRDRLQWFHLPQVTALARHMRGGDVGVASSLAYPLVEARRIEKLGQEYTAAVNGANWVYALTLLNAYNDADLAAKATEIQTLKGAAGLAAATAVARTMHPDDNHRIRRILAYVPMQAQTTRGPASGSMTLGAGAGPGVQVAGGGTVTAYEHATDGSSTDWFGFDYSGPNANQVGWIQFIAREGEKFDAAGHSMGFARHSYEASGQGETRIYSSPANQLWFVDSFGGEAPFYDAPATAAVQGGSVGDRGGHANTAAHTGMFDQPGLHGQVADDAMDTWFWQDDVDHVIMRAKFHDYLVQGNQVLYENTMEVSWRVNSIGARPHQTNRAGTGRVANRMQTAHFRAMLRRFPKWSFYPHG